jgi:hypothetical protein
VTTPAVHRDARSAHLISQGVQAVVDGAKRLGLQWGVSPATVQQSSLSSGFVLLILDGDTTPIQAMSLIGPLLPGWRVMVMSVPPSANYIIGSFVRSLGMVAYGSRVTNPATTTTVEVAILELDGVHVTAGVAYRIGTSSLIMDSTVANDSMQVAIRYTTDGTSVTTGSALMTSMEHDLGGLAAQARSPMDVIYQPTEDQVLNMILTQVRTVGTGSVSVQHINGMPIDMFVEAIGIAPPDGGIAL